MFDPTVWRDAAVALVAAIGAGLLLLRFIDWLLGPAPRPVQPPSFQDQAWDVLAEARQITIDAARER